jgi:hypothetical protein
MSYYFVELSHSSNECLNALDQILNYNPRLLNSFWFGCSSGDHTARAALEGRNEQEVREMIPSNQWDKLNIIKVEKYSPEHIHTMHDEQTLNK